MWQIKFRGRTQVTDEFVYGTYYYEHFKDTVLEIHAIISEYGEEWRVKPESVAQLIGIDANGREVYEGDLVIRVAPSPDWDEYTQRTFDTAKAFPMAATFEDYRAIRDEEIILVVTGNGRDDKDSGGRTA